jgi:hypothetical protein
MFKGRALVEGAYKHRFPFLLKTFPSLIREMTIIDRKAIICQVLVACTYNPSYLEG